MSAFPMVPPADVSQERNARAERRQRLLHLCIACAVLLALVGLARSAVSDVKVAGAASGDGCYGWADEVERAFGRQHVGTVCGLVHCESRGNPNAVSPGGDHGLLQLRAAVWNKPHHPDPVAQFIGHHWDVRYDGWSNLVMAQKIAHHYGFAQWSCYR